MICKNYTHQAHTYTFTDSATHIEHDPFEVFFHKASISQEHHIEFRVSYFSTFLTCSSYIDRVACMTDKKVVVLI